MRKDIYIKVVVMVAVCVLSLNNTTSASTTHYQRGRELFNSSRWVDARFELMQSLLEEGGCGLTFAGRDIEYMLAMSAAQLGLKVADDMLVAFEEEYPDSPYSNDMLFKRAVMKSEEGDLATSYAIFKDVNPERLSDKEREQYNIRVGYICFKEGLEEDALKHFAQIERESKFYDHALYYTSYIAYANSDYNKAREGFQRLMLSDIYSPVVPYYLLQIEFLNENYDRAIEYGTNLLKNASSSQQGVVIRTIAESHFRSNDYLQAVEYIDKFSQSGGEVGRTEYYIKGFSLHQLKRYDEAIGALRKACGADDALTQNASFHLANCYIHTNYKEGALKAFSMASNNTLNSQIAEEALFNQAKLQFELGGGHFNETINLLTRYIETYDNPKRVAVAQQLLAAAYYNSRDYETAYIKIKQIKNPDSEIRAAQQKICYLRGLELFCDGEYVAAESYLNESIKIGITSKQTSLATYWIGEIRFKRGEYSRAIDGYNHLIARAPKGDKATAEAHFSIAYALFMQGKMNSALDYFQRYLALTDSDPKLYADVHNRIGDIYYGARNFDSATKSYKSAAAVGSRAESNYAKYQVAIIKGVEGDAKGKIAELKQIVAGDDKSAKHMDDALYELGVTYIKNSLYRDAILSLERFIADYPRSPRYAQSLSDLGVAYINNDDSARALECYDKAIKAAPQSQVAKDAMQGIREIYVGQGSADKYFKYAESIGMEGDLTAVTRDSLSFASARGLYVASEDSATKQKRVVTALGDYIKSYPNGYYLNDALFYLSDCYIKLGDSKSAIATLTTLDVRGGDQYSERVCKMLSKLTYEEGLYSQSAAASRKLFNVAKDSATREEAMAHYAKSTIESGDKAAIEAMSVDILKVGEAAAGALATDDAIYVRATNLRSRGERAEALKLYQSLSERESAAKYRSESTYYIIDDAFRAGERDSAESEIYKIAEDKSFDAYWLARSFILLGDIYVERGDNFQARATYQSIVDGYSNSDDGVIDEATRKIGELK